MKFVLELLGDKWSDAFVGMIPGVAGAATRAADKTAVYVKRTGRAEIARAGFSTKWQNALRVIRYPKRGVSIDAAVWVYHAISYAGLFETGARIRGKPFLWVPLPSAPKRGRKQLTAAEYVKQIGPLVSINRSGRRPLLAGYVRSSETQVSLRSLRVGGRARRKVLDGKRITGSLRLVPLYYGISEVSIRRRFNFSTVWNKARLNLVANYQQQLEG